MSIRQSATLAAGVVLASTGAWLVGAGPVQGPGMQPAGPNRQLTPEQQMMRFTGQNPVTRIDFWEESVTQVYGQAFSTGATPVESAEAFRLDHAGMFGVPVDEITLGAWRFADRRETLPLMYDRDRDAYKFTAVYHRQERAGVPVYGAEMISLVRNEPGYPLVMSKSSLRDLGGFDAAAAIGRANPLAAANVAEVIMPAQSVFTDPELVIWAGAGDALEPARLAYVFEGTADTGDPDTYQKWEFVVDAANGAILQQQTLIHNVDITGNVSGWSTDGEAASICDPSALFALPYARVSVQGGNSAFADGNGDFTIPHPGNTQVTVTSRLEGSFFWVDNQGGPEAQIDLMVTPPGPANFVHNAADPEAELTVAEVDVYLHANIVRDFVMAANPAYPIISGQVYPSHFRCNANRNANCNAFYDGSSINFYTSGGGCNNTGFSDVVYHEYGHHVVQTGGSGQGQYGEGMSDVMGVIIFDRSQLGIGFQNCAFGIRDANNNHQYPCSGGVHDCGQLISGCVWDTRHELLITEPDDYLEILRDLAVNAVPLHSGSTITPQITIDWLTLDDDDANIFNGTPHYTEIDTGFSAHNMDAPPIDFIGFEYPNGLPESFVPNVATTIRVDVTAVARNPVPGTGQVHYRVGGGSFTVDSMNHLGNNQYEATIPGAACPELVEFYFSAEADDNNRYTDPREAPDDVYSAFAAGGITSVVAFDFENNPNWTVSGNALDGQWDRGIPVNCSRGDPDADFDGSGQCMLTDNSAAGGCNSDVDDGQTILTSQVIDLTGLTDPQVSYARWYDNTAGNAPEQDTFIVEVSSNGGTSWTNLETVGPAGPEVRGGWFLKTFRIADFVPVTSQFRIRWIAQDTDPQSVVEAGVDAFEVFDFICDTNTFPPTGFTVQQGILQGGGLGDLANSDDSYLSVQQRPAVQPGLPLVGVEVTANSSILSPGEVSFTMEANATAIPATVPQQLELFNYDTNSYEIVDSRTATSADSSFTVTFTTNPGRFVDANGDIAARMRWFDPGAVISPNWGANIDQSIWEIFE